MKIQRMENNGRHSVRVDIAGKCAVLEAEDIRKNLNDVYKDNIYHVLFDFEACDFIDSTGLGLLVSVHKRCVEHEGRMVILKPSNEVSELLRITRLDHVFNIAK